jgi:hypothetical protein
VNWKASSAITGGRSAIEVRSCWIWTKRLGAADAPDRDDHALQAPGSGVGVDEALVADEEQRHARPLRDADRERRAAGRGVEVGGPAHHEELGRGLGDRTQERVVGRRVFRARPGVLVVPHGEAGRILRAPDALLPARVGHRHLAAVRGRPVHDVHHLDAAVEALREEHAVRERRLGLRTHHRRNRRKRRHGLRRHRSSVPHVSSIGGRSGHLRHS